MKPICKPLQNACEGAILECLECQAKGTQGNHGEHKKVNNFVGSIDYILHLFFFIFLTEKWEKLNSVPLCYGARDDTYGEFAFSKAGSIMKLTLTHINGFLSCNPMYPPSYWGCDHPSLAQGKLMTLVTFQNRTRLQPAKIFGSPCNPQYSINGSSLNSTSLSFEPFDIPLAAAVDDNFQIWFGQDFTNCSEDNNAGVICVDVHALYS